MAIDRAKNFVSVEVAEGIGATDTIIKINQAEKLPDPLVFGQYNLVLYNATIAGSAYGDPQREIVRVTAKNGNEITVLRGQEETVVIAHNTQGQLYKLEWNVTAGLFEQIDNVLLSHNHKAEAILEDQLHRFVSDNEKSVWNAKSNLELGETETTAYRGDRGKIAYDHSLTVHAPADAYSKETTDSLLNTKVDKVVGKGLSTNDLTDALKLNYDDASLHSKQPHAPVNAQKNSDITKEEIEAKLTGEIFTHFHQGGGYSSIISYEKFI